MERYVLLAFTLLFIYVTFSCAEETKERTISVTHLESQPNTRCLDGSSCPLDLKCCQGIRAGQFMCCIFGRFSVCCLDRRHCCRQGYICRTTTGECIRPPPNTNSSVLREPAAVLVNSTGKRCRDGTADMNLKAGKSIPTQQIETAMKRSAFIGTSGDVSSPDEKYKCPEGTSTCELSSGNDGCCPIQNAKWIKIKIMNTIPHPHSSEDAEAEDRRP